MNQIIRVRLTWAEIEECGHWAVKRSVENYRLERSHRYGFIGTGLDNHFHGCLGEKAVAKHFGIKLTADELGKVDVDPYEVRATEYHSGRLVLHPGDRDHSPFVLARVHELPDVLLMGWIMGNRGKRKEWWGECQPEKPKDRPAFWVPNGELWNMADLEAREDVR